MTLHLELLESRENPSARLVSGDLHITGTIFNDRVIVTGLGGTWVRLVENGLSRNFNVWGGDIVFSGGSGNDYFLNNSRVRSGLFGDAGDDYLIGGGVFDYVNGGSGNDTLLGGPGGDFIVGLSGHDYLSGAGGNDYLDGGLGFDKTWSGAGFDRYRADGWAVAPDFDPTFDIVV
jgi:Ca2+-binding RTX toxin-like protein